MSMLATTLPIGSVAVPAPKGQTSQSHPPERTESSASAGNDGVHSLNAQRAQTSALALTSLELDNLSIAFNRRLKFEMNQDSNNIIVKVIDNETDKVIKVLPPEELQRLHSNIRETMGFLFDRTV